MHRNFLFKNKCGLQQASERPDQSRNPVKQNKHFSEEIFFFNLIFNFHLLYRYGLTIDIIINNCMAVSDINEGKLAFHK